MQSKGLIVITLTISLIPTNGRLLSCLPQGSKVNFKNIIGAKRIISKLDLFPDILGPDVKHHKIVKKQMTNFDYAYKKKYKRSLNKYSSISQVKIPQEFSKDISPNFIGQVNKFTPGLSSRFANPKGTNKKKISRKASLSQAAEERIIESSLRNLRRGYFRVPDEEDYRFFYECETEPSGYLQVQRRKCPEGEVFEPKFLECLKVSFLETIKYRTKRIPLFKKKPNKPEPISDPSDGEPANEWTDATSEFGQKIPCEFKPKQKPRLKIFYLRTKRKRYLNERIPTNPDPRFMSPLQGDNFVRRSGIQHHRPRSFLVRKDNQDESKSIHENNASEDEENEEDDDDDEAEEDDEEEVEESSPKDKSKECNAKEYIKSEKAVSNKAKYNESPGAILFNNNNKEEKLKAKSETTSKSDSLVNVGNGEAEDKKVLIDASIKVDSAISNALKNIITKSKEKSADSSEVKTKYTIDKQIKSQAN